jgi:hypothetical protein
MNSWVCASTPGVMPEQHRGRAGRGRHDRFEAIELVGAVDDDPADTDVDGAGELGLGLVVAVQHETVGRDAGGQATCSSRRSRRRVPSPPRGPARHRPAEERLGGVGGPVAERLDRLPAPRRSWASS